MTIESAAAHRKNLNGSYEGFCFPLAVDTSLRYHTLPDKWYEIFSNGSDAQTDNWNETISKFLLDFYGTRAPKEREQAAICNYNAFDASAHEWVPRDIPDRLEKIWNRANIRPDRLLLTNYLLGALSVRGRLGNNCPVLFTTKDTTEHVKSLQVVDPGIHGGFDTRYVQCNYGVPSGQVFMSPFAVTGIDGETKSPIKNIERSYWPGPSWELTILPPESEIVAA